MVRLVCMADTHMFHDDFARHGGVPDGDVLVHAGDMTRAGDEEEIVIVRDWLRSLPHEHKVVVAGNHDWLFQSDPQRARSLFADGFVYLEDEGREIAGLWFWGSPWQPAYHSWAFNLPRNGDALAAKWALIPEGLDVLVTHGPPFGVLDDASRYRGGGSDGGGAGEPYHAGCELLRARAALAAPRLHLFGHIHQNQGVVDSADGAIRFANCTTDECERRPLVVDLPIAPRGQRWHPSPFR